MNPNYRLRNHPIFICGHPKSGTSLVKSILDSHPQLVVYPEETIFFRRFLPQSIGLDLDQQLELAEKKLIHIFTWNRESPPPSQDGFPDRDYSEIPFDKIRQQMRTLARTDHRHEGDILSAVILAYGLISKQINSDTLYWVEKSPYNEYYAKRIFTWWPEARCIHILRDPRDNFLSYHRKHPDWRAEFFSANWNRSTNAAHQNLKLFGESRYFILRYEDLVQSPESYLRKLSEFLVIDWNSSLITPTRAGEQWIGNSMFSDRFWGISDSPMARWKDSLFPSDAATIELMSKRYLDTFHYPHETLDNLSFSQALRVRWRVATWPIRRRMAHFYNVSSNQTERVDQVDNFLDIEISDD
jgi:hypothetical protein